MFTSIIAQCINLCLPDMVHRDQVGFIPTQQASYNTRRNLNVIQAANNSQTHLLVLGLDIEKTFDTVLWSYTFATLKKCGFSPPFLKALNLFYDSWRLA